MKNKRILRLLRIIDTAKQLVKEEMPLVDDCVHGIPYRRPAYDSGKLCKASFLEGYSAALADIWLQLERLYNEERGIQENITKKTESQEEETK